ncbi:unnamed protein product [Cuscuta campestris]|uniref:Alcohol dehydrogenase-like C-terminal domain-containing protein n=1 Tax=Cuscuta campestris TaxID=132261 RepID=A0A484MQT0_9ASTE|nr:unnamed protein product [Cuscuta campestris]
MSQKGQTSPIKCQTMATQLPSRVCHCLWNCQVHQSLQVTVISTSADKKQEVIERFGVDSFLISCDLEQMQATKSTLDGIIDTVSAVHPLTPLLSLLKSNGKLVLVGLPEKPLDLLAFPFIMGMDMGCLVGFWAVPEWLEMLGEGGMNVGRVEVEGQEVGVNPNQVSGLKTSEFSSFVDPGANFLIYYFNLLSNLVVELLNFLGPFISCPTVLLFSYDGIKLKWGEGVRAKYHHERG